MKVPVGEDIKFFEEIGKKRIPSMLAASDFEKRFLGFRIVFLVVRANLSGKPAVAG